jgi:hypothetical protein
LTARTRNRYTYTDGGSYGTYTRQFINWYETTTDTTGDRGIDNPFWSEKFQWDNLVVVNGVDGTTAVENFVPDGAIDIGYGSANPYAPGYADQVNAAMMRTNPNRSYVDLPVFLFELKDLPKMIQTLGLGLLNLAKASNRKPSTKDVAKFFGKRNLEIQYGWNPLIADLNKLLGFQERVSQRSRELQKLWSKGGLKRRIQIYKDTYVYDGSTVLQSSNFFVSGTYKRELTTHIWATIRWFPDREYIVAPADRDYQALAQRVLAGWSVDLVNVWEAFPWSWLIDWFTNIGDMAKARRNTIPVNPSALCIMQTDETVTWYRNNVCSPSTLKCGDGSKRYVLKRRSVTPNPTPLFAAGLPFISASQWSILGSLAVARFF